MKARILHRLGQYLIDALNPGGPGPAAAGLDHLIHGGRWPAEQGLHAAVLAVADPAAQAALDGVLRRPGAEPDALHAAVNAGDDGLVAGAGHCRASDEFD